MRIKTNTLYSQHNNYANSSAIDLANVLPETEGLQPPFPPQVVRPCHQSNYTWHS